MTIILKCSLTPGSGVVIIDKGDLILIMLAMDTPTMTAINLVRGLVKPEQLGAVRAKCEEWSVYADIEAMAMAHHDLVIEVAV